MALSDEALSDPWRVVCPHGHSTLRWHRADRSYCREWGQSYPFGELVDKAEDQVGLG